MEFALLLQACLLMSTLERFSYDVLIWFFFFGFFCSVQVFCCVAASRNWSCRTNHAFALLMKWLATGKATPKQGTLMFQQNSVQGLFLLFFFKCILGSGCFYCCQKVASLESVFFLDMWLQSCFLCRSARLVALRVLFIWLLHAFVQMEEKIAVPLSMCWEIWHI